MASNVLDDEERFIGIVDAAVKAKEIKSFPRWKKDVKDSKAREKRKAAAQGEAAEAEELAKELGVHDKLFGNGAAVSKGKGKKGKGKLNEDGVDEDALKQLIQSRNQQKKGTMDSLIEKLEAKYGAAEGDPLEGKNGKSKAKGKKKADKSEEKTSAKIQEPTDEEFEALQKKLFGGKDGKKGRKDDDGQDVAPTAKRSKRTKS